MNHISTCVANVTMRETDCTCAAGSTRTEAEARAQAPRYCEDCIHMQRFELHPDDPGSFKCKSPRNRKPDRGGIRLVSRAEPPIVPVLDYCFSQRAHEKHFDDECCGPSGKWFEPNRGKSRNAILRAVEPHSADARPCDV